MFVFNWTHKYYDLEDMQLIKNTHYTKIWEWSFLYFLFSYDPKYFIARVKGMNHNNKKVSPTERKKQWLFEKSIMFKSYRKLKETLPIDNLKLVSINSHNENHNWT